MSITRPEAQSPPADAVQDTRPALWDGLGIVPGQVFRLCGMRRSGNHAITSWLQRNAPSQTSVFLNNCKPGLAPFDTYRTVEINARRQSAKSAQQGLPVITRAAGDGALLLVSYEDTSPLEFSGRRTLSGTSEDCFAGRDLIIYRSFLNWSASLLKKMQPNKGFSLSLRLSIILRAFDVYTRILTLVGQSAEANRVVGICYDDWMSSQTCRADILAQLGLPVRDNSLGDVQKYGGGSSFQKDACAAEELQTDQRWIEMSDDPEYQALLFLAARDVALIVQLSRVFPKTADLLARVAAQGRLPTGDVA